MKKIYLFSIIIIFLASVNVNKTDAHSGGTDSAGCHTCHTNCPSYGSYYGEYHCHTPKYNSPPLYVPKTTSTTVPEFDYFKYDQEKEREQKFKWYWDYVEKQKNSKLQSGNPAKFVYSPTNTINKNNNFKTQQQSDNTITYLLSIFNIVLTIIVLIFTVRRRR